MVPLVALSAIAVVLVIGIVAVIVVRAGSDDEPTVVVDKCVVGTWRVVDHTEKQLLDQGGTAEFRGSGYTVVFRADGTGHVDYNGATFRANVSGTPVTLVVNGKADFEFRTTNNQYTESNFKVEGTTTTTVGNQQPTTEPLSLSARPARYTCSGSSMVQDTELSHVEFRRS
jgi:hypothetical protein